MLDKKQIWAIFLFEFKVNHKAAETTCNINNAFSPGTGDECAAQGWFKKLCKGDKSLENEKCSGRPPGIDNDQFWKPSLKLILLQLHKKLPKNSASTILWSFSIWSKLEGWKSSVRGCLMSRPKIKKKKILILKCHLHLFYATVNHFLIRVWPVTKSEFYVTTGDNQLSGEKESREEKTKGLEEQLIKLLQRFRTVTVWGKVPRTGGASRSRFFLILEVRGM